MIDCIDTLRRITQDRAAMEKAQADLMTAWASRFKSPQRPQIKPQARFSATGLVAKRVKCPVARRLIEKTERAWSGQ